MKTLKITTDNKISIIDLDFDHKSLREEVGGYVELVRTQKLLDYFKTKVVMIVDEEGLVKNLPMNPMGCYFYDTDKHGNPIVGDRTVIENVHVYVNHKASVGDSGLNSAEVYKIRIPTDVENADQYLPPEEYAKLEDPEEHWTIQTDDQIILGEYNQEIEKPADLKDVRLRHCKVLSWSDNRFGGLPHWKIEGE